MKTVDRLSVKLDEPPPGGGTDMEWVVLTARHYAMARRTAVLSIIPGLGQLKNGETAKGLLFLAMTVSNVLLFVALVAGEAVKPLLTQLAVSLNRQPNWSIGSPFENGFLLSPAFILYVILAVAFVWYAVRDAYDGALRRVRWGKPTRGLLTLSEAGSGSYLVHLAIILSFVFTIILFVSPYTTTKQIVDIQLQTAEKPKPKPAPKPPAPKKEEPKPVQPKPVIVPPKKVVEPPKQVKIEPPKPAPVAVAIPSTEPSPLSLAPVESAPAPAVAPPSGSPNGQVGGSGGGSGQEAEVDMGPYMRDLQKRIKAHWFPPKGNENKRIKVSFKIYKDGHVARVKLISSSGVSEADDAAMDAIQKASPYATLPDGVGDDIDINFTFDYHVFGLGSR